MMSPTSQFKAEQIFDKISVLTFSSFDNLDIVVAVSYTHLTLPTT